MSRLRDPQGGTPDRAGADAGVVGAGGRWLLLYLALAAVWVSGYLVVAGLTGESGFPLDDAWIYQTYARNLARTGRWEYVPGQSSAGSTGPLWTALLAAGYLLHVPYQWWARLLGVFCLGLSGWLAHGLARRMFHAWSPPAAAAPVAAVPAAAVPAAAVPAVGVLCVSEWHLVWAAASGMETILFVALSLALMIRVDALSVSSPSRASHRWGAVGLLAGLLVLTRPEGVVLVALIGLWWLALQRGWGLGHRLRSASGFAVPFALLMGAYLLLNYTLGGQLWPSTYYAKQTEYAIRLAAPFPVRLWRMVVPPMAGFQALLVPGVFLLVWQGVAGYVSASGSREPGRGTGADPVGHPGRPARFALPLTYGLLHILLYAWRLPADYQHGRYLIPAIPAILLCGVGGSVRWLRPNHTRLWRRVISRSWIVATGALVAAYLVIGARAYAKDLRIIQSEMVAVANWLADNTAPDEWVAAHDIGAIGYFAGRPIVDLAGLISPEVVPLMADEEALADYVLSSPARYLVTAPGWPYEALVGRPDVVFLFSTRSPWTRAEGLNNSEVYRLPHP